jgi:hypothetical protein
MLRKLFVTVAAVGALVALAAGPAAAFDCYNTSRSDQGNASLAAHSPAFMTFDQAAFGFLTSPPPDGPGLCDAGAQWMIDQLNANLASFGLTDTTMISAVTVQAQGLFHVSNDRASANQSNGKGVDHLDANQALNDFIGAHLAAAFTHCP